MPFALFVSLSASDNVLPTMGSEPAASSSGTGGLGVGVEGGGAKKRGQGMAKALVDNIRGAIGEGSAMFGWKRPNDRL